MYFTRFYYSECGIKRREKKSKRLQKLLSYLEEIQTTEIYISENFELLGLRSQFCLGDSGSAKKYFDSKTLLWNTFAHHLIHLISFGLICPYSFE